MNIDTLCNVITYTSSASVIANHLKGAFKNFKHDDKTSIQEAGGLKTLMKGIFEAHERVPQLIIFICATGIAVRGIASCVSDKLSDPPVLVIDDLGHFVIPLLSGHMGGANRFAKDVSAVLQGHGYKAIPVITTATDHRGLEGFEEVLKAYDVGVSECRQAVKRVNMAIAEGEQVALYIDPLLPDIQPLPHPFHLYRDLALFQQHEGLKVCITISQSVASYLGEGVMSFFSKCIVVGTGCRKGLDALAYDASLHEALLKADLSAASIAHFASISVKANEGCILEARKRYEADFTCFLAHELMEVAGSFEGSSFVEGAVGVKAVAGPCAYAMTGDPMAKEVYRIKGCTFAFGRTLK